MKKKQSKVIPKIEKVPVEKSKDQEHTERIQRLQAEFENFRKRMEKEKKENVVNASASLVSQLLEILDDFELSLKHNKDEGVKLIYDKLYKILEKQGLRVIDTKGNFNPRIHEALIQVEGNNHGEILEELQKGYSLNEKLLRASKVKIAIKGENKNE